MELDTFEFVLLVANAHDDAVVSSCRDGEFSREGFALDDQRVVARRRERFRQFLENTFAVVMDFAGLSMKQLWRANDFSAECFSDGLMAQTNA